MEEENNKICSICFEELDNIDNNIVLQCKHIFCKDCLRDDWSYKIENRQISEQNLVCPEEGCGQPIPYFNLKQLVSKELLEKYDKFSFETYVTSNENEIGISCPAPNCTSRFTIWKDADYTTCPVCNYKFCTKCKLTYHYEEPVKFTCEEMMQKDNSDNQFFNLINENKFVKCPECKAYIELAAGCNYMTCESQQCQGKTNFCYLCGDKLSKLDHALHYKKFNPYNKMCSTLEKRQKEKQEENLSRIKDNKNIINCYKCKNKCELIENFQYKYYQCINCSNQFFCINCKSKLNQNEFVKHLEKNNCKRKEEYKECIIF